MRWRKNVAKRGAKTKLTPELQEKFCGAIRKGATVEMAAAFCSIGRTAIYEWIKKGKAQGTGAYADFANAAHEAHQAFGLTLVQRHLVLAVETKNTNAIQWQLERRFPETFARAGDRPEVDEGQAQQAESMAMRLLLELREAKEGGDG